MNEGLHIQDQFSFKNQFIAGNVAGWASITVAQPFDIFKTKCQLNQSISFKTLTSMIKQQGVFSLYRGASSVYTFVGLVTALQFAIFQLFRRLQKTNPFITLQKGSTKEILLSGSLVGFSSSFVYTPMEYTKIHTQIDKKDQGSASRIFSILRQQKWKGVRKLYTGHTWTMLKQTPGCALYFGGFYLYIQKLSNGNRHNASLSQQFLASSLAAVTYITFAYPFDTIKTNVQFGKSTFKELLRDKFWRKDSFKMGFKISLMRGLSIDMTLLTVYENLRSRLTKGNLFENY